MDESSGILTSGSAEVDDALWQYDGLHTAYQGECEEILLEMQMIFYEDLRAEPMQEAKQVCSFPKSYSSPFLLMGRH